MKALHTNLYSPHIYMKSLLGNCSLVGFKSCLLAILFLLGSTKEAQATDIFVQNFVKASTLLPNYQMLVIGDADFISQATNIQSYDNSIATVAFELNRDTFQSAAAFSMTARFEVTVWYKGSNPNGAGTVLPLFDLTLNHDPVKARVSDYRAFRTFKDVLKISVKVVSVTNTTAHSFIITEEILGNKTYKFDCSKSLGLTYSMNSDSSLMNIQGLIFAGLSVENPDEYEFEWNFYETESELGKRLNLGIATTNEINATFRFNATRVSKTTNSIEIPVLYRFGYIIFRIRASRYLPDGRKEFSKWIASWDKTKGHEQNLNWQSDLTFAEEGKSVATVKYFDGTLRERQAQTYSKANATTIATQTIYDHNGRPAAKTMPLPTLSDTIKYRSTLAMTQGTSGLVAFTKMVFDTINSCSFAPPAMINDGRTYWSRYYSTNNPEKTTLKGSVIPNAEGFHYTMTEFTADNTGRIKKQSGVGATFRMGGTKETQYFYGKPSQEELDRLFGSEVGYASHYQKNMVRDPNDQYSVSYVDAHGRTVATALAGGIPTNLDALVGSNLKPTIKRNILNNVRKGDSLVTSYSLLLPAPSAVKVVYGITKDSFRSGCEPSNICYDCQYDVRIQITEACEGYANPNPNYRKTMTTFAANAVVFDTICSNPPIGLKDSINIASLPQGEYIVTKILKIHRPATDYYAENFVTQSNCKPNLTTLSQQMRATADGAGCFFDCKTCTDSLGTEGQYVTKYLASIGSTTAEDSLAAKYTYVRLLEDCNALCSNYSECGILYKAMLGDVSPGGQYCLDSLDASGNVIPRDGASMLFGLRYQSLLNGEVYRDALGRPDTVEIDGVKKLPTQLNRNEFITYWKPTWAKALVNQHPEYCYWQNCNTTNLCNKFDSTILTIETFAGALAAKLKVV